MPVDGARRLTALPRSAARATRDLMLRAAGGPARARVVLLLAGVLGLNAADFGTVSATTGNLEHAFGIGNTDVGLLISAVALISAIGTIPIGVLTDRTRRTALLSGSILIWSVALLISGAAPSYLWLLLSRLALGVASATTGPTVSSLVGDLFPAAERSRMYGLILGGQLAGTGIGFVVSGEISSILPWRFAYWWLILPGLALAWLTWRLPEPARGGQGRIPAGAQNMPDPAEKTSRDDEPGQGATDGAERGLAERAVRHAQVEPQADLVLHTDPVHCSLWWAVRYVLRIRTNVIIIIVSALGYFFFTGLQSFAIIYVIGHYGVTKSIASVLVLVVGAGAVVGVFASGRVADRALARGHIRARVLVPMVCLFLIPLTLAPAIATRSVALALPLLVVGAALLGAPNAPLDAARLDIIHPRLWGRAEAVRTSLRSLVDAAAPTTFGLASQQVFGGPGTTGLEYTFLLGLIPLLVAAVLLLPALRTYPRDVATASASLRATTPSAGPAKRQE
jgi:predicted MFS family arabinose efflux permease